MAKPPRHTPQKPAPLPTKEQVLAFLREAPGQPGKREVARAFRVGTEHKIQLKALLRDMEREGLIGRERRRYRPPGAMADVMIVEITGTDADGEVLAKPLVWEEEGRPPRIYVAPDKSGPALGPGDRVLVKLRPLREHVFQVTVLRRVAEAPGKVVGVFAPQPDGGGRIRPTDRRLKNEFAVARAHVNGAVPGELVVAEMLPGRRLGLREAKVVERLGKMGDPRSVSLIAIIGRDIPTDFPPEAVLQAERAQPVTLDGRTDLRAIPLVTIDGSDARDFDDAVWAEPDTDPANEGGWHVLVAIADVSWYVRPNDPLDRSAYERGNSVYFPDRVVPMLPEALSNELCSLKPDVDRACMACHMWIGADGQIRRHKFVRGLMRSAARLTYEQVQRARDGVADDVAGPLAETIIAPLYGAFAAFLKNRETRGVLELDLPERRVFIGPDGMVEAILPRPRLDSHKLIEEFMIAANVAAAETLEGRHMPCMYRVHDQPAPDKVDALRTFLQTLGYSLPKGQVMMPRHFNQILAKAVGKPDAQLVNDVVLRSQAQAAYSPDNLGHFGLALSRYAHFTSPIRRYADLLVHRGLIRALKLGEGGLSEDAGNRFVEIGEHISGTERRAAAAEREAIDRFTAAFLADRVGAEFGGRINGVTRFGLFVTLDETGADGLIPVSSLPDDYYLHDEAHHCLTGKRTRNTYTLGDRVAVVLTEADAVTGGLIFNLLGQNGPGRAARPAPSRDGGRGFRSKRR